jgi:hypothetical protein
MFSKSIQSIFLAALFLLSVVCVSAQMDASTPNGKPREEELPKSVKENLAKGRIDQEKKDYAELLERGDEALKLSDELEKSFAANNHLNADDMKKVERLEKLVKKIRTELGGEDGEDEVQTPSNLENAFTTLKETTSKLVTELKNSTRWTISAVAIQSSNALLKVVKFLRFSN